MCATRHAPLIRTDGLVITMAEQDSRHRIYAIPSSLDCCGLPRPVSLHEIDESPHDCRELLFVPMCSRVVHLAEKENGSLLLAAASRVEFRKKASEQLVSHG